MAEHLLGYRLEVVGKQSAVVLHDPEELRRRSDYLDRGKALPIEPDFNAIVGRVRFSHPVEDDWTYLRRDGERVPVRLSITALPDDGGDTAAYLFVAQDLRGRHDAEELLRRQATLLDLANNPAIFVRDLHLDTILYWNHGAVRLYGWSSEEAVGAYIHDFAHGLSQTP